MQKKEVKTEKVWEKIFEKIGCPAHIFSPRICKTGLCCIICHEKCRRACSGTRNCPVFGLLKSEMEEVLKSKSWNNYTDFCGRILIILKERRENDRSSNC